MWHISRYHSWLFINFEHILEKNEFKYCIFFFCLFVLLGINVRINHCNWCDLIIVWNLHIHIWNHSTIFVVFSTVNFILSILLMFFEKPIFNELLINAQDFLFTLQIDWIMKSVGVNYVADSSKYDKCCINKDCVFLWLYERSWILI